MYRRTVLLLFIFASCREAGNQECSFQDKSLDGSVITIKGCMKNSVEIGHWIYMDSVGNIIKEGNYDNGILNGLWEYNFPHGKKISLEWRRYESKKFNLYTNIPTSFSHVEEGDHFVKFQGPDTSKAVDLVIVIHDTTSIPLPPSEYHLLGEKELTERGWFFERQSYEFESEGDMFYFNFYKISKDGEKRFIWSVDGALHRGRILEVFTNSDTANEILARTVFTSVSSSVFIDSKRWATPYKNVN